MNTSSFCLLSAAAILLIVFASDAETAKEPSVWDSIERLSERLEHVERVFDEEKQRWQMEKQR